MNTVIEAKEESNRKKAIIQLFTSNCEVRILGFEFLTSKQKKRKCCAAEEKVIVYQQQNRSLGRIRFCCEKKLLLATKRTSELLQRTRRSQTEIYRASYKLIRGSVGQILLQASFGINTRIYLRENKLVKEHSILRNINYLLESCNIEEWNAAILDFQRSPREQAVAKIISLYSPLFRADNLLIARMTEELLFYLEKTIQRWKGMKKRIAHGHLGVGIIIEDMLVNFKFTERKLTLQKSHFEQLYRNYHSICRSNPGEKERIKKLAIFSPITCDFNSLGVEEAAYKWELEKNFNRNFTLWQLKNYIGLSKNDIFIADKMERSVEAALDTRNPFFEKLKITQKNE